MKAFLTGGTGFIGSHLVDLLLARDVEVYLLVRNPDKETSLRQKKVHVLRGDLFSIPELPAGLDVVFHLAGKTRALKSGDYYTVNQEGTASLFRSLLRKKDRPRVIFLSSQAACGPSPEGGPVKESDPPRPIASYGRSKLRAEEEALKFKDEFPVGIIRASAVFGPRDRDFLAYFKFVAQGIILAPRGSSAASLVYVKDLAEALFRSARFDYASGEIFNIADSRGYTWTEFGEAAAVALRKRCRKIMIPKGLVYLISLAYETGYKLTRRPGLLTRDKYREMMKPGWLLDVSKAAAVLSFRTRYSLDQAVRETISWYLAEGWI